MPSEGVWGQLSWESQLFADDMSNQCSEDTELLTVTILGKAVLISSILITKGLENGIKK